MTLPTMTPEEEEDFNRRYPDATFRPVLKWRYDQYIANIHNQINEILLEIYKEEDDLPRVLLEKTVRNFDKELRKTQKIIEAF